MCLIASAIDLLEVLNVAEHYSEKGRIMSHLRYPYILTFLYFSLLYNKAVNTSMTLYWEGVSEIAFTTHKAHKTSYFTSEKDAY